LEQKKEIFTSTQTEFSCLMATETMAWMYLVGMEMTFRIDLTYNPHINGGVLLVPDLAVAIITIHLFWRGQKSQFCIYWVRHQCTDTSTIIMVYVSKRAPDEVFCDRTNNFIGWRPTHGRQWWINVCDWSPSTEQYNQYS
jgi:hypothetical protein